MEIVTIKDILPAAMPIIKWCFGTLGAIIAVLIILIILVSIRNKKYSKTNTDTKKKTDTE